MGVVYKAHDTELDRDVALKFLPHHITVNEAEQARFLQEARAAAVLNHPNICTVHAIEKADDQQFIVMEYVEGKTLRQLIPTQKTQIGIDYAIQIGEALQEAHSKGIVHRDIKADNIMVNSKNQIKVMDFGLAKLKGSLKLTKTSSTVGTLAYMAPEQIQGGEVDARSDIFSFGVVLYEILTGHLPFRGEHEAAMMYSILNEEPTPIQKHLPDISSELVHILNRALEKDPEDRYQHVDDMVSELRRLKKSTSKVSRAAAALETSEGIVESTRKPKEGLFQHRWAVAGLFVVCVVVLVGAAYFLFFRPTTKLVANRVAVAVFENRTEDPSLDGIGTMIRESLLQGLPIIEGVEVEPPDVPIPTAGMIVRGSYWKQGDSLVVYAKIMDGETGKTLRLTRPITSQVQNSKSAVGQIQQHVMGAVAFVRHPYAEAYLDAPSYYPVYEAFGELRAAGTHFRLGRWMESAVRFQRCFKLDPTFVIAAVYEAMAYLNARQHARADSVARVLETMRQSLVIRDAQGLDFMQAMLRGDALACLILARQLAKIPLKTGKYLTALYALHVNNLHEARDMSLVLLQSTADTLYWTNWVGNWWVMTSSLHLLGEHDRELKEAVKARSVIPNSPATMSYEVRALCAMGREAEVWKRVDESRTLGNSAETGSLLVMCVRELRRHGYPEAAQKAVGKAIEWYTSRPDSEQQLPWRQSALANAYYVAGRYAEAREIYKALLQKSSDNMNYQGHIGTIAARTGDTSEARRIDTILKNMNRPYLFGQHTYWRACIAALLGQKDDAVSLLRDAFGQGQQCERVHADIDFESVWDYPPFKELVKSKD
jgi:tetratricopeptide (TPR) repeat protein/predicted Ser/Thr protein kinase